MPSKTTSTVEVFDTAFLKRVERLSLQTRRWLRGGLSGEHPSRRYLPAPTFSDHRSYVPGDDFRHVDWPAYARHEELYLKLGETEQDVNIMLALDCSTSLNWGIGATHKGVYVLRLAALLGAVALASNDHVQVWPFHQRLLKPFGPATGRGQTPVLLQYLRRLSFEGQTNFELITQRVRAQSGGLLIVLSDLWHAEGFERLLQAAAAPRWQTVVLHVLHPDEIRPGLSGQVELEDSETGVLLEVQIDDQLRNAYYRRLVQWVRQLERTCRERQAQYVGVRTDRPLEQALVPLLRRRGILS